MSLRNVSTSFFFSHAFLIIISSLYLSVPSAPLPISNILPYLSLILPFPSNTTIKFKENSRWKYKPDNNPDQAQRVEGIFFPSQFVSY